MNNIAGCTVFSVIDLKAGFNQIPMDPAEVPKTAVITPFGLFEWLQMPFGLMNSCCMFQRKMHEVLGESPFIFCYVDDMLVASRTIQEHKVHLREVFNCLRWAQLTVNIDKSTLARPSVEFLGQKVDSEGIGGHPASEGEGKHHPPVPSPHE